MIERQPYWLDSGDNHTFPPVNLALDDPNGLLAVGGDLSPERLLNAYQHGIFPWYNDDQPILWWSPDPRCVLFPEQLRVSRRLRKTLRQNRLTITLDTAFTEVLDGCAAPRDDQPGTWITPDMKNAYQHLHHMGYAHSVEAWEQGQLCGGLYGIAIGRVFFGESMFSRQRDASKLAFVHLVRQLRRWGYTLIDCQVDSNHLRSLGAVAIGRDVFITLLQRYRNALRAPGPWVFDQGFDPLEDCQPT